MRHLTVHPPSANGEDPGKLRVNRERADGLAGWLSQEIEDALSARYQQEENWTECLRQYEGVPKSPIRNVPIENAPNLEITLGAIASDSINAQAVDLIFNQVSPLAMAQATHDDPDLVQAAKDMQVWLNVSSRTEWNIRPSAEQCALDWNQLGTGVLVIDSFEEIRKTRVYTVRETGARVRSHPVEDLIVPGGAYDELEMVPWVALRFWPTQDELNQRAKRGEWDITQAQPSAGNLGWMRTRREQLGRTITNRKMAERYEILDVYCHYDIDNDGIDEDLLVTWDRNAKAVLKCRYLPYDRRPVIAARYQKRGHLFYAMGVLEMMKCYQDALTEDVNQALTNGRMANTRAWKARPGVVPGGVVRLFENKVFETSDPDGIAEMKLSDVYPSSYRNQALIISFAERRVGVRELSGPSPARVLGGRTPGITALSMLQQVNQRFAPAFDDLRAAVAGALRQCCWRYRERLLANDERAAQNIRDVLGTEAGERVIDLLTSPRFEESVSVELTATSASINRAQDRQDAILLMNVMGQYYQRAMELVALTSSPQATEPMKKTAQQIFQKVGEIMDRTIRTFDSIRDPSTFILDMTETLESMGQPQGLEGLAQMLGQVMGGGQSQPPLPGPGGTA